VCPHRVINSSILSRSCQRIFGLDHEVIPVASVRLEEEGELERFANSVVANRVGYLFFHAKLGGEVSISGTSKSPELSFDITIVEIKPDEAGGFVVSRYGILELQTMDYHGTYVHSVNNLRDGLRLHPATFPQALEANLDHWSGEGIEGPNIANVFKRTFYQMLLKFRLAMALRLRERSWHYLVRSGIPGNHSSVLPSWKTKTHQLNASGSLVLKSLC
jgi:hypothetical protein